LNELRPILKSHFNLKKTLTNITEFEDMITDSYKNDEQSINFDELPETPPKKLTSPMFPATMSSLKQPQSTLTLKNPPPSLKQPPPSLFAYEKRTVIKQFQIGSTMNKRRKNTTIKTCNPCTNIVMSDDNRYFIEGALLNGLRCITCLVLLTR
jgi:hypothetical protein